MQSKGNGKAGMNANAANGNGVANRGLPGGFHSFVPRSTRVPHPGWPQFPRGLDPAIKEERKSLLLIPFVPRDEKPL